MRARRRRVERCRVVVTAGVPGRSSSERPTAAGLESSQTGRTGIVTGMGLGFGLLSAQLRPGETDWTRAYDETIQVAVEAERLGFTSVWTTEHHFVDDGYMPSLLVVGAALAQATSRIELGTGVILAPMHHPLRLAEDAATVQLLSHGRLLLGLGLGWSEIEYAGLGADARRRGAAMDEILRILPQAWTGEPFTHQGDVYSLPTVGVRPAPSTTIPILIGGSAEPAVRRAARLADGLFANAPVATFVKEVQWVLEECERIGRDPATFRFIHYSVLLPGPSREAALARYKDALWAMQWKYSDMEISAGRALPPPAAPAFQGTPDDMIKGRATFAGTADEIVDALQDIRRQAGVPVEFAARSFFPLLALDDQLELMAKLAEGVAPHV
jgi:probable F420-dependent oxidoreductase